MKIKNIRNIYTYQHPFQPKLTQQYSRLVRIVCSVGIRGPLTEQTCFELVLDLPALNSSATCFLLMKALDHSMKPLEAAVIHV